MSVLGIIPVRYHSTRFPGKALVKIEGKTMIRRVYEQACQAKLLSQVLIATDDERIFNHAKSFGAPVVMTAANHPSGTDRVAEAAKAFPNYDIILNIQGDEPYLHPGQLDQLCQILFDHKTAQIATLAKSITSPKNLANPNQVKVVLGKSGQALYFSRQVIPYIRDVDQDQWMTKTVFLKHLGLYAFRREALMNISQLPPGQLEQLEKLEQLRWLEHGIPIFVGLTDKESIGIDTIDDLKNLK